MIKWYDLKVDGIPDYCGDYLIRYINDYCPEYVIASISEVEFFDDQGEAIKGVTHWAKISSPDAVKVLPYRIEKDAQDIAFNAGIDAVLRIE